MSDGEKKEFPVRDTAAAVGLAMIGIGLWWASPPASMVVVGALVMAAAVFGHVRGGGGQ